MRLMKVKITTHHQVKNSGWFSVFPEKTLLAGKAGTGKAAILKGIEVINPLGRDRIEFPSEEYPQYLRVGGFQRRIIPEKKTCSFAVFVCDDALRNKLIDIDPVFAETDRIEVGRRMDARRWMTFVEIAGSARWQEIAEDMRFLKDKVAKRKEGAETVREFERFATLKKTDRIKGDVAVFIDNWLKRVTSYLSEQHQEIIDRCLFVAGREERAKQARKVVYEHLPFLICFAGKDAIMPAIPFEKLFPGAGKIPEIERGIVQRSLFEILTAWAERKSIPLDNFDTFCQELFTCRDSLASRLSNQIRQYYPGETGRIAFRKSESGLELVYIDTTEDEIRIAGRNQVIWWLLDLLILINCAALRKDIPPILLLVEPEDGLTTDARDMVHAVIARLAADYQILYSSSSEETAHQENYHNIALVNYDEMAGSQVVSWNISDEKIKKAFS